MAMPMGWLTKCTGEGTVDMNVALSIMEWCPCGDKSVVKRQGSHYLGNSCKIPEEGSCDISPYGCAL